MGKYMIIDGIRTEFTDERNILQVIHKAGIHVPTFCYYSDLSIYGACRMCVVEDERGNIMASCSTLPKDKMVIKTNTGRLHNYRKMILELLLASHCRDCTTCDKNQNCRLQLLARRFGIDEVRFKDTRPPMKIDDSSLSIVRDPSKCILCGDCVRMCNEVQHVGAIDFVNRGSDMMVTPAFGRNIADTDCVNCGQCAAVCPTGAITIKSDLKNVWKAIYEPGKRVVAQIAPAVRVALGEEFGLEPGKNSIGKIFTAMRMLGFDTVFDTSVAADLTIMEEAAELVEKLQKGDNKYPLFTSCCPGWIRFAETKHPELMPYISTCKSPMEMFGAVIKEYYKPADKESGLETVSVAVMPCVAKKYEAARDEFKRDGIPDVDYVITTKELIHMIREVGIQFNEIEPGAPDMPFSISSGAGVIFGVTGGVTEAALRRVAEKNDFAMKEIEYSGIRGMDGIKTADVTLGDTTLKIAVVSGLGNADKLIEAIEKGEMQFDFVEVMACPYGCIAGAGQPFSHKADKAKRATGMYKADKSALIKRSEENPVVKDLYEHGLLKDRAHELLHVHYTK
ncbi:MAG: [FeFe] hydrogenase, group A [Butyrivibrio sp.]